MDGLDARTWRGLSLQHSLYIARVCCACSGTGRQGRVQTIGKVSMHTGLPLAVAPPPARSDGPCIPVHDMYPRSSTTAHESFCCWPTAIEESSVRLEFVTDLCLGLRARRYSCCSPSARRSSCRPGMYVLGTVWSVADAAFAPMILAAAAVRRE
ncbi:hypothetical protein BC628DRAFT_1361798 [Trametes gibbosa]|nr:hypothetical protein BC628DRAFT_1361798 [Trametes gibbosa]